jgi:hypothetical protein
MAGVWHAVAGVADIEHGPAGLAAPATAPQAAGPAVGNTFREKPSGLLRRAETIHKYITYT